MTTENTFNLGDTVRLKSGGPTMTINKFTGNSESDKDRAECFWFDKAEMKREIFQTTSLEKI